ncbi:MAG: hypothetical protein H0T57_03455 [Rubrobacter sp.]|nr:hypothetical protein [Rubrobacter sp.]MBA3615185.1 hypothetical protein [Rubrobacteraceae bacterium]
MSPLRFVVLVIVLALLVAALFALATRPPDERCSWIDAERVSVEKLEALRDEGWHPIANDDKEALYSPGCLTLGRGA